jgi:hypothetical protein
MGRTILAQGRVDNGSSPQDAERSFMSVWWHPTSGGVSAAPDGGWQARRSPRVVWRERACGRTKSTSTGFVVDNRGRCARDRSISGLVEAVRNWVRVVRWDRPV